MTNIYSSLQNIFLRIWAKSAKINLAKKLLHKFLPQISLKVLLFFSYLSYDEIEIQGCCIAKDAKGVFN